MVRNMARWGPSTRGSMERPRPWSRSDEKPGLGDEYAEELGVSVIVNMQMFEQ